MSLSGNLSNFRFGDLLQTLAQNRQWGVLRLRRGNETRQLSISERGIAHLDLLQIARKRIEERLLHQRFIDRGVWMKLRSPDNAKKPLLTLLKEVPGFDASVLSTALQDEEAEQIHALLDWTDGDFELLETVAPPEREETPPLDVNAVVLDGARRMDERAAMGDRVPDRAERFVALEAAALQTLSEDQTAILGAADGVASLRAIADRTVGDLFSAMKIVLDLETQGLVRRLQPDEILAAMSAAVTGQDLEAARSLLDLLERTRSLESDEAMLDVATRWRALGDNGRAAGVLTTLAQRILERGDPTRSGVVLREAIALSPRDLRIRRALIETLRAEPEVDPDKLFVALRDVLLLCADRGNTADVAEIEEELLAILPADGDEEARVGRALGRLGRGPTAAELLIRAGKRMHRAKKKRTREALDCFRDALTFAPTNELARQGFEELSGRRSVRRRTTAAIAAAVIAVVGLAAVPFWCGSTAERDAAAKLARAQEYIASGDLAKAADVLNQVETTRTSAQLKMRAEALREKIPSDLLERASSRSGDDEGWADSQFNTASNRLEEQDYAAAFDLYDTVLEKRDDERRRNLIKHRLLSIDKRLRQDARRITELLRAVTPNGKEPAVPQAKAQSELESLADATRREHLASLAPRLESSATSKLLSDGERASLRQAAQIGLDAIDHATLVLEPMRQQKRELAELAELEPILIEGRKAETAGDARGAAKAFASLSKQYPGQVLKDYLEERTRYWGGAVELLDAYERAVIAGDAPGARHEIEELRTKFPEVNVAAGGPLPLEVRTTPKGAAVSLDGELIGQSPVIVRPARGAAGKLRAEFPGFEAAESTVPTTPVGRVELTLSRKAAWSHRMAGAISANGCMAKGRWIVGDRRGNVCAFDPATGVSSWTRKFETLGGIQGAPVADGSRVFVSTVEGDVYALDPSDGRILSRVSLREPAAQALAIVDGNCVVVTAKENVFLVAATSATPARTEPMYGRATTPVCPANGGFAIGTSDGSVLAYDTNGRLRWRSLTGEPVAFLMPEESSWLAVAGVRLSRLDAKTGAVIATRTLATSPVASPSSSSKSSYWVAIAGQLLELDRVSLETRRTMDLASLVPSQVVPFSDGFLAACAPGALRFDVEGTLCWARVGSGHGNVMLIAESLLGVVFEDGEVVALTIDR